MKEEEIPLAVQIIIIDENLQRTKNSLYQAGLMCRIARRSDDPQGEQFQKAEQLKYEKMIDQLKEELLQVQEKIKAGKEQV